ncbi:MAG: phytanoyl-CoA dioxygenase family protein [Planctomycetota bacterium]|nr:phytanoyl-CoA dioxygenase family protein [Planctomycetota bacterium]MDA1162611.1 phytanoyl-CoA dioxygenase family protein [Planctomycetota bacterium]
MPKFNAVPDQSELEQMDRDLRFYPSQVTDPDTLTPSQIEQYNRDGYLRNLLVFPARAANEIRLYFDGLLNRTIAAGGDSYSISSAHLMYGPVYDLLREPRIVAFVKDILGKDVIGWGSHFFCKMPFDGKSVAWHQDASYWPLTPSKAATVWLAIDDADIENGCMRFVAGSQHVGHLTYRPSSDDEGNVLNQTIDNAEQYGEVVYDELKAGEISLHSDLLLHGSEANNSDRRRCGLTLRYCTPDVVAGSNWHEKGVVVSGVDYSGNWANPSRPNAS